MAKGTITGDEVLDLAADLFATRGYRSTSLEVVARQLGVTRQALYYHFTSKGEILKALFDKMMTRLEVAVASVSEQEGQSAFEAMLYAHILTAIENAGLVALLLHERPEISSLDGARAARRRREYMQRFVAAFEVGVRDGRFVPVDSAVAVNTLISAANGISSWYDEGSDLGKEKIADMVARLLSRGFLRGSDGSHQPQTPGPVSDIAGGRPAWARRDVRVSR